MPSVPWALEPVVDRRKERENSRGICSLVYAVRETSISRSPSSPLDSPADASSGSMPTSTHLYLVSRLRFQREIKYIIAIRVQKTKTKTKKKHHRALEYMTYFQQKSVPTHAAPPHRDQNTPGITRYGTLAAHSSHSAPNCFFKSASSVGARAIMLDSTYASIAHQQKAYTRPAGMPNHPASAHHEPGPKCTSNVPKTPSTTPL